MSRAAPTSRRNKSPRSRSCTAVGAVLAAAGFLLAAASAPRADPVADFYSGKTVRVLVGFNTGGGYDIYARTLARHIGRYIPGNPALLVQNMPGAGSLKAVQYLYNV